MSSNQKTAEQALSRLCLEAPDSIAKIIEPCLLGETGTSTAGYPFLSAVKWEYLRSKIPHILNMGSRVMDTCLWLGSSMSRLAASQTQVGSEALDTTDIMKSIAVVKQVVNTAAVTAPPDLWVMRHVFSALSEIGVIQSLNQSGFVELHEVVSNGFDLEQLELDLSFLSARGLLCREQDRFSVVDDQSARACFSTLGVLPEKLPTSASISWISAINGESLDENIRDSLIELGRAVTPRESEPQHSWLPLPEEVNAGFALVPLVVALCATGKGSLVDSMVLIPGDAQLNLAAVSILMSCGVIENTANDSWRVTAVGARVLSRGPGPFGIVEAYHPYMNVLPTLLRQGRGSVHVTRGANIVASQLANRRSFLKANDSLDRFCAETGFSYCVFIEHAMGKG